MTGFVSVADAADVPAAQLDDSVAVYSTVLAAFAPAKPVGLQAPSTLNATPVSAHRAPVWTVTTAFVQLVLTEHAVHAAHFRAAASSTANACTNGVPTGHATAPR